MTGCAGPTSGGPGDEVVYKSRCGPCSRGACGLEVKTDTGEFNHMIITTEGIGKERYMVP